MIESHKTVFKVSPGNSGASVTMIRMLRTPGHCSRCGRQLILVVRCRLCPPSGLCSESPDRRFLGPVRGGWAVCSGLCHSVTLTAAGLRLTAPAAYWPVLCTALTVHSTLSPSRPVLTQQPGQSVPGPSPRHGQTWTLNILARISVKFVLLHSLFTSKCSALRCNVCSKLISKAFNRKENIYYWQRSRGRGYHMNVFQFKHKVSSSSSELLHRSPGPCVLGPLASADT